MNWFSLALALLSVVKTILQMIERRKAEKAAEARILLDMLEKADAQLVEVRAASDAARERARGGLLNDDDFRAD